MNDDELSRLLRDEIPEPEAGYWDAIDARIASAASERTASSPAPVTDDTQTDDGVIRLTDMTNAEIIESPSRTPWLFAAAACVVLVAVGAFALTRTSDDQSELDTIDTPDLLDIDAPEDAAPSEDTDEPPAPGDGSLQPDLDDSDEITDVSPGPDDAWDGVFTDIGPAAAFIAVGEDVSVQLLPGDDQPESAVASRPQVLIGTGNGASVEGIDWIEVLWGPELTFGVFVRADEVVRLGDLLEPVEPAVIAFTTTDVNVREWPALEAPVRFLGAPEVTIGRTGIRVAADGFEWIQLVDGFEGPFTWVAEQLTTVVADAGVGSADDRRSCYADGTNVLVLDFSDDAETFSGGFAFLDSVESVSGVRDQSAGSVFDVTTSPVGSAEDDGTPITNVERWLATADGLSIGERAFLEPVDCSAVAADVERLDGLLGLTG